MNPKVRQRVEEDGEDTSRRVRQRVEEDVARKDQKPVDWTSMIYDPMLHIFTLLDYPDRASLASTCKAWRSIGASPYLWSSLDLRGYRFNLSLVDCLANRCADLQKVRFSGLHSSSALVNLKAKNLREISGEHCGNVTDAKLSMIVACHKALESLHLGPGFGEKITSEAIKRIAIFCPKLKSLRLSGMRDVSSEAITSLAQHCPQLSDVGFLDCLNINEEAFGQVVSLRYLAVTGTSTINWRVATESWEKLPNLTGLDVSRTSIDHVAVSRLLTSSQSLKVVCALNCHMLENVADFDPDEFEGKILIAKFNNTLNGLASILFEDNSKMLNEETMCWIECNLSCTLLYLAENNLLGLNSFWHNYGPKLFLRLMQSSQEDVQERAATGLAAFIHMGDDNASISVMRDGGIPILLKFAKSWKKSFQSEAARAIANLSLNDNAAKAVAEEGGVDVILGLTKSRSRLVAHEAAGALWHLSLGDAYKAILQAGGVNVLMELLSRWPYDHGELLERAAGALANLAGDDKCSREIAKAGGVHALVMLARNCKYKGAQEHAARGLANLAAHDDSNNNNAAIGKEPRALETIIQLTRSHHGGVKLEAAGALWNLAYDENNRELIAALGGVQASVALAYSCMNASRDLQKSAAGALWSLSHSDENSIVIGLEGGIPPLVALARSQYKDVHEAAAGALWNLSSNHDNALGIVEEGGVLALGRLCTTSPSKMARFLAALTLAYIIDGRLDECVKASPGERSSKSVRLPKVIISGLKYIERFINGFMDPKIIKTAASSFTPSKSAQVLKEVICIPEDDNLRCSGEEIGRFVKMLSNPSPVLQKIAVFALLQFTLPGASHAKHHASLMHNAKYPRLLRIAAAATSMPREAKIFAKIVVRNLEYHHQPEFSKGKKVINFEIRLGR
ncbi:Protein ARABIDILLO 2 [Raphanus sativus]|uniref:Protein ARABIDILLO 2-like n=1 Tax=Raphanus sativus TaxID=3726 RepID=A0A6J0NTC9_RAPSA|nr:protein ARABIDILLO 2-like [Raphanus sativus]KAJ4896235.1 Protein ARABIDILLO 2 [Raphanus sativus]